MSRAAPVAVDLDRVLGDTRPLWQAWLETAEGVLGSGADGLSPDRGVAARQLDERGGGNWRDLLARFAEERVAVHVRRDPASADALRALAARGAPVGVFTDAPEPLARAALVQLGADRRVDALETGQGALERLLARLGPGTQVIRSRDELHAALSL